MRWLKWIGTTGQIVGVFALSSRAVAPAIAFAIMLAGSTAWLVVALRIRDRPLAALNTAFTISNIVGLLQWASS